MTSPKTQQEISGAEAPSITALDDLIAPYLKIIDKRQSLQNKEPELKAAIDARMKELNQPIYPYVDGGTKYTFKRSTVEKLSFTRSAVDE